MAESKVVSINKYKREGIIFVLVFLLLIVLIARTMGLNNMFKTLFTTAYQILINTCFYIMAVTVLAGGLTGLLNEFGVIHLLNKPLNPLMGVIYDLPGVASIGIITTYLSDNPAIISLSQNDNFKKHFKSYQLPSLTNLGTAFGMGLVVSTFMISLSTSGESFWLPVMVGNLGALIGSIISVRLMNRKSKKIFGLEASPKTSMDGINITKEREIRPGSILERFISALLDGGHNGVKAGLEIIPGVVIITTTILLLTNGPSPNGNYTGGLNEGVPVLPFIANKLDFVIQPLLGFSSSESIIFPMTALGSVGAALGVLPNLISKGIIKGNDIAVFTAMGMCWSGYLSTHIAMMDSLKMRYLTKNAIVSHTIGGLCAGVTANYIFKIIQMFL